MDNQIRQILSEGHIDADGGVERCAGNEALYRRLLVKFLHKNRYGELKEALSRGELNIAEAASHDLKGVGGNLSITGLSAAAAALNNVLKPQKGDGRPKENWPPAPAELAALMEKVAAEYGLAEQAIARLESRE